MTRSFVDTNVLVYRFDEADPGKQQVARDLLRDPEPGSLVLSTQVLQEFYAVATRKLATPLSEGEATQAIDHLSELPVVGSDATFVRDAIRLSRRAQLSIWDALVVQAAASAQCERILTEDLSHGTVIDGVGVHNPFAGVGSAS